MPQMLCTWRGKDWLCSAPGFGGTDAVNLGAVGPPAQEHRRQSPGGQKIENTSLFIFHYLFSTKTSSSRNPVNQMQHLQVCSHLPPPTSTTSATNIALGISAKAGDGGLFAGVCG